MFRRILIANRGEIARRIVRTCRRLFIETVAIYSDADREAPHVREADAAMHVGPAPARDSYLRVDRIVAAACDSGADAIHPGYGFLSENPALPRACAAAGIAFVGPTPETIEAMGSKIAAKRRAVAAGVPVVPGFDGDEGGHETLLAAAERIGFPLLVKASAGGGGRGMRSVADRKDIAAAIRAARTEARAAFGDDRLLLERLVTGARHVEVQIAADHHGNFVHLFERDCSVQRTNQKILEEAPAPNLSDDLRARLLSDAVRLAREIEYRNLGTMEFMVDAGSGEHFFLEMNTRLQVEHPVTEMITGLDLVELQIRIAAGEPLPVRQTDVQASGHAIEARLTAERPEAGYMPSTGRVVLWMPPRGARVDAGVETGSEVTIHYDPMIAKVIAHGPTREHARSRLKRALSELVALGPATNRTFLLDVIDREPFAAGHATTDSLARLFPGSWSRPRMPASLAAGLAAAIWCWNAMSASPSPWSQLRGFRVVAGGGRRAVHAPLVDIEGERIPTRIEIEGDHLAVDLDRKVTVLVEAQAGFLRFCYGEERLTGIAVVSADDVHLRCGAVEWHARVAHGAAEGTSEGARESKADVLAAPAPGLVVDVMASTGHIVAVGEPLVSIESMKLVMTLRAPRAGRVSAVHVTSGQTVKAGAILVEFEPAAAAHEK